MIIFKVARLIIASFPILLLVGLVSASPTTEDLISVAFPPEPQRPSAMATHPVGGAQAMPDRDDDEMELELEKTVNWDVAQPGDVLVYTIVIINVGDDETEDIELEDELPEGVSFVTGSLEADRGKVEYDERDHRVEWEGELDEEDSATITFEVTVKANVPSGTVITNTAVIDDKKDEWEATATVTIIYSTATNTPQPPMATNTPQPPTATNTPQLPTATNTPQLPTATNTPQAPTATNTPQAPTTTNTPQPPTVTNTPVPEATSPNPSATATTGPSPTATVHRFNYVYLPVVSSSPFDLYGEPNDNCGDAFSITTGVRNRFLAEDRDDWYRLVLPEAGLVTIRLTEFSPAQGQIAVYSGQSCGEVTFIVNNGDPGREKTLELGQQAAGVYFIYVSNDGVFNNVDPYLFAVDYRP